MLDPDNVKVPVPVFVKVPVLEIIPDKVMGLVAFIVAAVVKVTAPEFVDKLAFVFVRVPLKIKAFVVVLPFKSNTAPELTVVVPVPKPEFVPSLIDPAEMVVPPL